MKLRLFLTIILASFLTACATSTFTVGKDFPTQNISKIEKKKTTADELIALLGKPYTKTVVSDDSEKWIYTYSEGKSHAQSYVVTMKVKTTGHNKTLDVLLKNGVVVNYTYSESDNPYASVNAK